MYETNPNRRPDTDYEPGEVHHLLAGTPGRLLDPRRTPVRVVEVRADIGSFIVEIEGFEDAGARWTVPVEEVGHYQFEKGWPAADPNVVSELDAARERFDRPLTIACDAQARARTLESLARARDEARHWITAHSAFVRAGARLPDPAERMGSRWLFQDLQSYLRTLDLWSMEDRFATQFVSNPYSGELVKGHRVVLAELGLAAFEGKAIRDPSTLRGEWSRERREAHILARMGLLRGLFAHLGLRHVELYRGISGSGPIEPARNETFVSATFHEEVARSHFDLHEGLGAQALFRQFVPIERLFMTYLETDAMSRRYREAEAVLLFEGGNRAF